MKSDVCKEKVNEFVCGKQIVPMLSNSCGYFDPTHKGSYLGCFKDTKAKRVLTSFEFNFADNTPTKCIRNCLLAGYSYGGVEFERECFCGEDSDVKNKDTLVELPKENCLKYRCPQDKELSCGGFEAIAIYSTGLATIKKENPVYVDLDSPNHHLTTTTSFGLKTEIKILFLLQLNGRNDRQVKRMLKAVYSPKHYYVVHVDKRQSYMHQKMKKLETILPNLVVSSKKWSTIWGGTSLLEMYLTLVGDQIDKDWDYVINMSESDFLVMGMDELEAQLIENNGKSFLSSHGSNAGNFIKKQAFYYKFMECEDRMWRVNERNVFPDNMFIDGGSDWIVIHKSLMKYALSNEVLPVELRNLFESVLLPLESFFHTLVYNSKFCTEVKSKNLRLTYWNRKQGCRCAKLKKIVDWCGCSPLVYREKDIPIIKLEKVKSKATYFSRKFDDILDIRAIHFAEKQAIRNRKHIERIILDRHQSYNSSWVNLFDRECDGKESMLLERWVSSLLEFDNNCNLESINSISGYKGNAEAKVLLVVELVAKCREGSNKLELLVEYLQDAERQPNVLNTGFKLSNIEFGLNLDYKEEIFRDFLNLLKPTGTPFFLLDWMLMEGKNAKTSPQIYVEWYDGKGALIVSQEVHAYDSIFSKQHTFLELELYPHSYPGIWQIIIKNKKEGSVLGKASFPVFNENNETSVHTDGSRCTCGETCSCDCGCKTKGTRCTCEEACSCNCGCKTNGSRCTCGPSCSCSCGCMTKGTKCICEEACSCDCGCKTKGTRCTCGETCSCSCGCMTKETKCICGEACSCSCECMTKGTRCTCGESCSCSCGCKTDGSRCTCGPSCSCSCGCMTKGTRCTCGETCSCDCGCKTDGSRCICEEACSCNCGYVKPMDQNALVAALARLADPVVSADQTVNAEYRL
uniref:Protein xylosyltransferase n=1 Tax=Rhabditophanes sp. KR3021 TaxID=114890 RepID=A0AC35TP77_9BILA